MFLGFAVWEVGFRTFAGFMDGQAGFFRVEASIGLKGSFSLYP